MSSVLDDLGFIERRRKELFEGQPAAAGKASETEVFDGDTVQWTAVGHAFIPPPKISDREWLMGQTAPGCGMGPSRTMTQYLEHNPGALAAVYQSRPVTEEFPEQGDTKIMDDRTIITVAVALVEAWGGTSGMGDRYYKLSAIEKDRAKTHAIFILKALGYRSHG
jgi:hypothetical protein